MGAWGYGSFQNDTALDFVSTILDHNALKKLVNKNKIDHYDYDQFRVTAEILIHLHKLKKLWVDQEVIEGLIRGLNLAIDDKSWHDTWREPLNTKIMINQLKKFVKQLTKLNGY